MAEREEASKACARSSVQRRIAEENRETWSDCVIESTRSNLEKLAEEGKPIQLLK
jgi:hypothetical protein